MTLKETTIKLEALMPLFIEAQREYSDFMNKYECKKSWWLRQEENTALKNAEMREAHLYAFLENEGIIEEKMGISNKYYRLRYEKEFLIELSKSLRIIEAN